VKKAPRTLRARLAAWFGFAVVATLLTFGGAVAALVYIHERVTVDPNKTTEENELQDIAILQKVLIAMGLVAPTFMGAAAVGGWWFARTALLPMREAAARARESQADANLTLPVRGSGDEWDDLAVAVNGLLAHLRQSLEWSKSFTANAAHELRTPLTAMIGEVQVTLRRDRSPAEYRESLSTLEAELGRLARLVDGLLALARSDARSLQADREAFDLNDVLLQICKRTRKVLGEGRVLDVRLAPVQGVGDAFLTERIVENLLDNAVKYGGDRISVRLGVEQDRARVEVADNGPGLPESVRSRLFERFNRVPSHKPGFGLGLALSRALAQAQGATLSESSPGGGTRFLLEFPLVNPRDPGEPQDALTSQG